MFRLDSFIALYLVFPETEGKSLQQIEYYFSDKTRKWTDRRIRPIATATANGAADESSFSAHNNAAFTP